MASDLLTISNLKKRPVQLILCTFFFPQLVATFPFLLVPSVGVSVPLQLLSFSPVRYQDEDEKI